MINQLAQSSKTTTSSLNGHGLKKLKGKALKDESQPQKRVPGESEWKRRRDIRGI